MLVASLHLWLQLPSGSGKHPQCCFVNIPYLIRCILQLTFINSLVVLLKEFLNLYWISNYHSHYGQVNCHLLLVVCMSLTEELLLGPSSSLFDGTESVLPPDTAIWYAKLHNCYWVKKESSLWIYHQNEKYRCVATSFVDIVNIQINALIWTTIQTYYSLYLPKILNGFDLNV